MGQNAHRHAGTPSVPLFRLVLPYGKYSPHSHKHGTVPVKAGILLHQASLKHCHVFILVLLNSLIKFKNSVWSDASVTHNGNCREFTACSLWGFLMRPRLVWPLIQCVCWEVWCEAANTSTRVLFQHVCHNYVKYCMVCDKNKTS